MIFLVVFFLFLFTIFFIFFVLPTFSPIPYFPSNHKDTELIMKSLRIADYELIIDLGAGDGWIVFEAAKRAYEQKLKVDFIAVEINPILIGLMHIVRYFHPYKNHITILKKDMFTLEYEKLIGKKKTLIYFYISPWFMEKVLKQIGKQKNVSFVSYLYKLPGMKHQKKFSGRHEVFIYY